MSLIKLAIESGPHSNLPNAWFKSKALGQRNDIPLAKGINSSFKIKDANQTPIS
jgi:hypothetical protein